MNRETYTDQIEKQLSFVEFMTSMQNKEAVDKFYAERKKKYSNMKVKLNHKHRKIFIQRFKYCQICGSELKLELVHIIPVASIFKTAESLEWECCFDVVPDKRIWEIAFLSENIMVLCKECHDFKEKSKKFLWGKKTLKLLEKKTQLFKDLQEDELFKPCHGMDFSFEDEEESEIDDWCAKFQKPTHEVFECGLIDKYPNCSSEYEEECYKEMGKKFSEERKYKCPHYLKPGEIKEKPQNKDEIDKIFDAMKKEYFGVKKEFGKCLDKDRIETEKRRRQVADYFFYKEGQIILLRRKIISSLFV